MGEVVEAKFLSSTVFKQPTGTSLLILLAVLLSLLALGFQENINSASIPVLLPLGVCAAISGILGFAIVPLLRRLKTGQIIQEDGIQTHLKKAGTPTMGGIFNSGSSDCRFNLVKI